MTKHFAKELTDVLAGPPKISQTEFALKAKLTKSKLSRLLSCAIACDRPTMEFIIGALSNKDDRTRVVSAYLQDVAGPEVLGTLNSGHDPLAKLELDGMSRKGRDALKKLVHSTHREDAENILIDLAKAFGL